MVNTEDIQEVLALTQAKINPFMQTNLVVLSHPVSDVIGSLVHLKAV